MEGPIEKVKQVENVEVISEEWGQNKPSRNLIALRLLLKIVN